MRAWVWLAYCRGLLAVFGLFAMASASGSAGTGSSAISARYLTCRILDHLAQSGQICSHDTSSLVPRYSCLPAALPGQQAVWQHRSMDYVLAQVNVGRLLAPLDSPLIADFVAALDPVNALADASPGNARAAADRGRERDGDPRVR